MQKFKKDIFSKSKRKLIISSTLIIFTSLIIFACITLFFYKARVLERVDLQLEEQKEMFIGEENPPRAGRPEVFSGDAGRPQAGGHNFIRVPMPENMPEFPEDRKNYKFPPNVIAVFYENDKFIGITNNNYFSEEYCPDLTELEVNEKTTIEDSGFYFRAYPVADGNIKAVFLININSETESVSSLEKALIFSLISILAVAAVFSVYLVKNVMKPVKEAYNKQVHFVQDASHEMRTPLAVIKGKLELMAANPKDKIEDHFEYLSKTMTEIRALEKLNSDLLLLSKEGINFKKKIESFSLNEFLEEAGLFYEDLAEIQEKNFKIIMPDEEVIINTDKELLKRMITILLENAFKYTDKGNSISLILAKNKKHTEIKVQDTGIGIKKEEIGRIFDRFYRSGEVRGKNISGTGIGLSLLKTLADMLGMGISVQSEYGQGSCFIIKI